MGNDGRLRPTRFDRRSAPCQARCLSNLPPAGRFGLRPSVPQPQSSRRALSGFRSFRLTAVGRLPLRGSPHWGRASSRRHWARPHLRCPQARRLRALPLGIPTLAAHARPMLGQGRSTCQGYRGETPIVPSFLALQPLVRSFSMKSPFAVRTTRPFVPPQRARERLGYASSAGKAPAPPRKPAAASAQSPVPA